MAVLLVTYDLDKPGQNYDDFLKVVKSYAWARLSESSYAIETDESPSDIYKKLSGFIDKNDQAYIITLKSPHAGWGPTKINEWLQEKL